MRLPREILTPDEELVIDIRPHWVRLVPDLGVTVALFVIWVWTTLKFDGWFFSSISWLLGAVTFVAAIRAGVTILRWLFTHFVVTSERVIVRSGVIAKQGIEIPLDRINTVFFDQTVLDRVLGAGDLIIESASEQGRQRFEDVKHPNSVQQTIYRCVEQLNERQRRRAGEEIASAFAGAHTQNPAAPQPSIPAPNVSEELERLARLRDTGVLTPGEFEALKAKLLR